MHRRIEIDILLGWASPGLNLTAVWRSTCAGIPSSAYMFFVGMLMAQFTCASPPCLSQQWFAKIFNHACGLTL